MTEKQVLTLTNGEKWVAINCRQASLRDRWNMFKVINHATESDSWNLRLRILKMSIVHMLTPSTKACDYIRLED